jgi:hypothetical protein
MANNDETLNKVHRKVIDEVLRTRKTRDAGRPSERVIACDQQVRKAVSELFRELESAGNPAVAVELLSEHTAILVEMINVFKKGR